MKLKVFALRDVKADAFGSPFFVPNDGIARRVLSEWVRQPGSDVAKYPAEFMLFEIGEYDNESALLTPTVPTVMICSASSCLPKPDPRQLVMPGVDSPVSNSSEEVSK